MSDRVHKVSNLHKTRFQVNYSLNISLKTWNTVNRHMNKDCQNQNTSYFAKKKKSCSRSPWLWISLHCFYNHCWVGLIVRGWQTSWHVFLSFTLSVTTESGKVVCWTASVSFRCGKPKYQWRTWCVPKMFVIVSFACFYVM